jgi:hypothetical protein
LPTWTLPGFVLVIFVVVVNLACGCAVAADAAPAHNMHVVAATVVTESSRITPLPSRTRAALVDAGSLVAASCGRLVLMRDSS